MAAEWGYLTKAPKVRMVKEPGKLPPYVTPEHCAQIYAACGQARMPADLPYPAADWWRALLMAAYMTGWRIGELLALARDSVDLDKGTAITWHEDNKASATSG